MSDFDGGQAQQWSLSSRAIITSIYSKYTQNKACHQRSISIAFPTDNLPLSIFHVRLRAECLKSRADADFTDYLKNAW